MLTVGVWIASEEVMDKVILSLGLARVVFNVLSEAMVKLSRSVGAVVSILKELTERLSLVLLLLSTEIVQLS